MVPPPGADFLASLRGLFAEAAAKKKDTKADEFACFRGPLVKFLIDCGTMRVARARANCILKFTDDKRPMTDLQLPPCTMKIDDETRAQLDTASSGNEFIEILQAEIEKQVPQRRRKPRSTKAQMEARKMANVTMAAIRKAKAAGMRAAKQAAKKAKVEAKIAAKIAPNKTECDETESAKTESDKINSDKIEPKKIESMKIESIVESNEAELHTEIKIPEPKIVEPKTESKQPTTPVRRRIILRVNKSSSATVQPTESSSTTTTTDGLKAAINSVEDITQSSPTGMTSLCSSPGDDQKSEVSVETEASSVEDENDGISVQKKESAGQDANVSDVLMQDVAVIKQEYPLSEMNLAQVPSADTFVPRKSIDPADEGGCGDSSSDSSSDSSTDSSSDEDEPVVSQDIMMKDVTANKISEPEQPDLVAKIIDLMANEGASEWEAYKKSAMNLAFPSSGVALPVTDRISQTLKFFNDNSVITDLEMWAHYEKRLIEHAATCAFDQQHIDDRRMTFVRICYHSEEAITHSSKWGRGINWERRRVAVRICAILSEVTAAVDEDLTNNGMADWVANVLDELAFMELMQGPQESMYEMGEDYMDWDE
ncbi:hypothetical protein BKA56DRAFT_586566 [Ilyonectria sp. MPI-CAGE-AT-0026]|nr:hypothetical protein BKA56DRAFT_586566 [Ilyonectria sp. MPI-CAGE-AT-0026]